MTTYFERQLKEFEHAIHSMDMDLFDRWVEEGTRTLKEGRKIIASGLGKNVPVCEKFVGSMQSLGLEAYFLNTNSAVHGDLGVVREGDMVILLTKSGETAESIYLTKLLKERNANLWLLSFRKESTLTREIKNCMILDLIHEGDQWNIMPNNSTTINLIVLQGLAMKIGAAMGVTLEEFKKNHPGGHIGAVLSEGREKRQDG